MSLNTGDLPTRGAALACIAAVRPADYTRSRNAIDRAVTHLSPYITHGFVTLAEVLAGVASRHRLDVQHKFVIERGGQSSFAMGGRIGVTASCSRCTRGRLCPTTPIRKAAPVRPGRASVRLVFAVTDMCSPWREEPA